LSIFTKKLFNILSILGFVLIFSLTTFFIHKKSFEKINVSVREDIHVLIFLSTQHLIQKSFCLEQNTSICIIQFKNNFSLIL
jgi:hypothetical protein